MVTKLSETRSSVIISTVSTDLIFGGGKILDIVWCAVMCRPAGAPGKTIVRDRMLLRNVCDCLLVNMILQPRETQATFLHPHHNPLLSHTVTSCASNTTLGESYVYWTVRHLTYLLLTYSMVQSPSWTANWFTASQEIPRISRNPKVHYRTHKRPPLVSILGQHNPVHIPTSHLLQIHPNIIHPSTPRSPQWSLSLRFILLTYSLHGAESFLSS